MDFDAVRTLVEQGDLALLSAIVENLPNPVFVKDSSELRFVLLNAACEQLVGADRKDWIGKNDHDLFPEEQATFFQEKDRSVLESGGASTITEEPVEYPSGYKWLRTRKVAVPGEDGTPRFLLGISEEITKEKALQQEVLHASKLSAVYFPIPMILLDIRERIVNSSANWVEQFGPHSEQAGGLFFHHYDQFRIIEDTIRDVLEVQVHREVEFTVQRNGSEQSFVLDISPWSYPDDSDRGVSIIATEITSLKEKERALQQQTDSLEKANDELAQFAYRASHDLKSPLSAIKLLADFIVADIQSGQLDEATKNATVVRERVANLEGLVANILDLARSDLEQVELVPLDIESILRAIEIRLSHAIEEAGLHIVKDIAPLGSFKSEEARITQILENLISNGIKYRKGPSPQVEIHASRVGDKVAIKVADNGVGIPPSSQQDVFKMFKRFHPDNAEGSGLGLSIVKKHVESLGGSVCFETSGEGTTFTILLPDQEALP